MRLALLFIGAICCTVIQGNLYHECGKLFNPHNYMDKLPSLSLPYLNNVPYIPPIKPSPVITTKVINIVTKYVYKNPVCVKVSGKKSMCKSLNPQNNKINVEHLVTKEYFVSDRRNRQYRIKTTTPSSHHEEDDEYEDLMEIEGSEEPRPFTKQAKTPTLSANEVKDMLIEDRLDQLETILPHYTRRRVFQTSTITVTKVRSNNRATATLLVKNCLPQGYDLCPPKIKKRKSKVAKFNNSTIEPHYYG